MRASFRLLPAALAIALVACRPGTPAQDANSAPAASASVAAAIGTHGMTDAQLIEHGEYLSRITGCNDCHTPGYAQSGGQVPKDTWLVGSPVGWTGPWGTTYPANLRLKVADMDDAAWLDYSAKLHTRPPMPDFAVRDMKEADRLALFRFIKSLGPGGDPAPAYLPPGQTPPVPFVEFNLPAPPPEGATAAAPVPAAG
jgi:mono/diheme cytochrome c family protein